MSSADFASFAAGFAAQIVGDDAGVARLGAARIPEILEAEIGIEGAVRRRGQTRVWAPPHARCGALQDLGILPIAEFANAFQLFSPEPQTLQDP